MGIEIVELTPEETELFKSINYFKFNNLKPNIAEDKSTFKNAKSLTLSLIKRKAIPETRYRYFFDPEYVSVYKKSHYQIFKNNGTIGEDVFSHPQFLPYLKYFLYGPELPKELTGYFYNEVTSETFPTSGDIPIWINLAKKLTREYDLNPQDSCEEFYKLALESGISPTFARIIRDEIRKMKRK